MLLLQDVFKVHSEWSWIRKDEADGVDGLHAILKASFEALAEAFGEDFVWVHGVNISMLGGDGQKDAPGKTRGYLSSKNHRSSFVCFHDMSIASVSPPVWFSTSL